MNNVVGAPGRRRRIARSTSAGSRSASRSRVRRAARRRLRDRRLRAPRRASSSSRPSRAAAVLTLWRARPAPPAPERGRRPGAVGGGVMELLRDRRLRQRVHRERRAGDGLGPVHASSRRSTARASASRPRPSARHGAPSRAATFVVRLVDARALAPRARVADDGVGDGRRGRCVPLFPFADGVAPLEALSFAARTGPRAARSRSSCRCSTTPRPPGRQGEVIGVRTTMLNGSTHLHPAGVRARWARRYGMAPVFWSMAAVLVLGRRLRLAPGRIDPPMRRVTLTQFLIERQQRRQRSTPTCAC